MFVTASFVVDRGRPPISQLDSIPPTSSYPSGHTAAAVAFYGAIAIIVFWHTRNRVARGVAFAAAILLPLIVGGSRMYRGMHHLSDVVVGAIDRSALALVSRMRSCGTARRSRTNRSRCPWLRRGPALPPRHQACSLFVPQLEANRAQPVPQRQARHRAEDRLLVVRVLQVVVGDLRIQVMDVVEADVAGEELQYAGQAKVRAPAQRGVREAPFLGAVPVARRNWCCT